MRITGAQLSIEARGAAIRDLYPLRRDLFALGDDDDVPGNAPLQVGSVPNECQAAS